MKTRSETPGSRRARVSPSSSTTRSPTEAAVGLARTRIRGAAKPVVVVFGIPLAACDRRPAHEHMIARIGRPVRAAVFLPLVLALCGFASASRAKPHPAPPTPAYSPPTSEESPFSRAEEFCVPDANRFETVAPMDPQVRAQPADVVWLTTADATIDAASENAAVETFGRLVDECGGIGGRPLDVHIVRASADPGTDCAAALRFHPVIVVSTAIPAAWSCIVHDQRTVLVTGSDASNADLTGSGGRLVATGSTEGIQQARLLSLVDSGRLDGRKVAIVTGADAIGTEFRKAALAALATDRIRPVALASADAVLVPTIDLGALPLLQTSTASARRAKPLDVYGFDTASASIPAALAAQPAATARQLRSVNLYAFSPVTDPMYRANQEPNTFSGMCNRAAVDKVAKRGGATTTSEPQPPLGEPYLATADVCLLTRIVARALFAAGPTLDQRAVITALHRLPYVDQPAPGGTPKARPNQVVNEPVRRIEQVVVLDQVQSACPSASTTTTTTAGPAVVCWMPAPGWNAGGVVVNLPLAAAPVTISH